jgi:cell division protein YceG involved in septum cleavage
MIEFIKQLPDTIILVACCSLGVTTMFMLFWLRSEYPSKNWWSMVKVIFRDGMSFYDAIKELEKGRRIRRKKENRGYTRICMDDGKTQSIKYGSYYVRDGSINNLCAFDMQDVLAHDWVVDD